MHNINRIFCSAAILLWMATASVQAQQSRWWTVATDYNTCLQGMKDQKGNWVIEPKYETIMPSHFGYFVVSIAEKYGVLNETGAATIPLVYDNILQMGATKYSSWTNIRYFVVRLGDKSGVVDSINQVVVPIMYKEIATYADLTIAASGGNKEWELYHLDGTHFPMPWKSRSAPGFIANQCYSVSRKFPLCRRKWGIVDDSGHVLLERKYDQFSGYRWRHVFRVTKNDKYGYCSDAGKMIWPVVFSFRRKDELSADEFWLAAERGTGPAIYENQYGLITITGDTILPFIYDKIRRFGQTTYNHDGPLLWIVEKNGLSGIFDEEKGWVVPAECSHINTVAAFNVLADSTTVGLLVYQKNGLWGAVTTHGQEIVSCVFEDYLELTDKDYLFRKKDSIVALSVCRDNIREKLLLRNGIHSEMTDGYGYFGKQILTAPDDGLFRPYSGLHGSTAFYFPDYWGAGIRTKEGYHYFKKGEYHGFCVPDTVLLATAFSVQPVVKLQQTTRQVQFYGVSSLDHPDSLRRKDFCVIRYSNGRSSMTGFEKTESSGAHEYFITTNSDLVKDDGQLLVSSDTVFYVEAITPVPTGELFFRVSNLEKGTSIIDTAGKTIIPWSKHTLAFFSGPYLWEQTGKDDHMWQLVNHKTGERLLPKEVMNRRPEPIWNNTTVLNDDKHGKRLYNISSRTIVTPTGFDIIESLNREGTLFAVKTCTGAMGVISPDGVWISDTVWTAFTPFEFLQSQDIDDGDHYRQSELYRYYIFYNDTANVTIDGQTGNVLTREQSLRARWNTSLKIVAGKDADKYLNDSCVGRQHGRMFLYISQTDTHRILPWHRQCIQDSIFTPVRTDANDDNEYEYPCDYCYERGFENPSYRWIRNYPYGGEFATAYIGDSVVSFYHGSCDYYWSDHGSKSTAFSTVMMYPEGPRQVTLDSLFDPAQDWKNFVINSVITYVNTHPGVKGDCHNPSSFPVMLQQSFLVTAEGLALYPEGFTEYSRQLVITVPWKDVNAYLRADIKTKLPSN